MKLDKNSKLIITKVSIENTSDGRIVKRYNKEVCEEPLNLGSINNPLNIDVVRFEYDVPSKGRQMFFGPFFGGGD